MSENGKGTRRLPNWIESFLQYSENIASPVIFRKWAAISVLGSILERRVWSRPSRSNLYANLYVILVGPPGVGKSQILGPAEFLLRSIKDVYVAPSSLTTASMIDTLSASTRPVMGAIPYTFNSLQVIASELGVFLPAYDAAFMNTLTKLYDGEFYEERRRTGKVNHIRIESPLLSILGGTTPSYLNAFLPDGAWDQGFTSRTIFIYHGEIETKAYFVKEKELNQTSFGDLAYDLSLIFGLKGQYEWTDEAISALNSWMMDGFKPVPGHAKLKHYNSRRSIHIVKLSMISAISRSSELIITLDNFAEALSWLLEAEALIPEIFMTMGVSADSRAMQDLHYSLKTRYAKTKQPISEHILVNFLKDRVKAYEVKGCLEVMVRSKLIQPILVNQLPFYVPL